MALNRLFALAILLVGVAVAAQDDAAKFAVASVKRCAPSPAAREGQGPEAAHSPDRLTTPCTFLAVLIDHAFVAFAGGHFNGGAYPVKLEGLPAWAASDLYKIEAKAEGTPGMGMMNGPMLQSLLEDRFALKIHWASKDGPAYALTIGKRGFGLRPFRGDCIPVDRTKPPEPIRDEKTCRPAGQRRGPNVTFDDVMDTGSFASYLATFSGLDAPVIDKTGINGNFRFHIEYASDLKPGDRGYLPPTDDPPFPSVFTAVQQQLGLKLEAIRAPRRVLVVDHVERPSAN